MRRGKLPKAVIIGAVAVIVVLAIVISVIYIEVGNISGSYHVQAPPGKISSSIGLQNAFFASYNNSAGAAAYAKLYYQGSNASYANFSLRVFRTDPVTKIYLIDVDNYCINCFLSSTMENELKHYLGQYGLLLNQSSFSYIQLNNLSSIEPNSIIIVPSGLIPLSFLPLQNSSLQGYGACPLSYNYSIINLLRKGDTVIYVGQNFSRAVSCGQQIIQVPSSIINVLANNGISYMNVNSSEIKAAQSQRYLAFNTPTFVLGKGLTAGSATYLNVLNGSLVALSNYPSQGWSDNSSLLARDIAALIDLHYWNGELATGSTGWQAENQKSFSGSVGLVTNTTQINTSELANTSLPETYGLATAYFFGRGNSFAENNIVFRMRGIQNGYVGISPAVPQTAGTFISAGATNISSSSDSFHIYIYNLSYENPVQYVFIGQMKQNVTFIKPISFYLPGGYYVAALVDLDNNTYARGIFRVYNTTITPVHLDFSNRNFTFSLHSGNYSLNGVQYSISLNGKYLQNGTVNNSIIRYSLPGGSVISYGNESFSINVFGKSQVIIEPYQNSVLNIPPFYIEFAIAAVIILVLNKILVPPNIDRYYINVQEFRQASRAKVKEPAETILKIFDQVNYYYHWRYMPLNAEEIKSGISNNVRYGNMPIAVTLQNTYNVLNKLSRNGLIVESGGYFAPKSWIDASKHDIEYLSIFRMLRDYCVANAMLFTDIDAYENVDMIITNKGVQNYVYIYSKLSDNAKLGGIPLSKSYRTFIVFLLEEDRLAFIDRLNVSYGEESEILRVSIESLDIRLIDTHDLGQLKL